MFVHNILIFGVLPPICRLFPAKESSIDYNKIKHVVNSLAFLFVGYKSYL